MISDKEFKKLLHCCKGYTMHLNGQVLEPGYKPDYALKKDNDYIILECDNNSSRKHIIGGMIKAAHFLQGERTGRLVCIIAPKDNTKAESISKQLRTYFNWIKDKTNLREVHVIETGLYYSQEVVVELFGKQFKKIALKV
jgi:hypothetical protein